MGDAGEAADRGSGRVDEVGEQGQPRPALERHPRTAAHRDGTQVTGLEGEGGGGARRPRIRKRQRGRVALPRPSDDLETHRAGEECDPAPERTPTGPHLHLGTPVARCCERDGGYATLTGLSRSHGVGYGAWMMPPSTGIAAPVTYAAAGEETNAATRANSSGSP